MQLMETRLLSSIFHHWHLVTLSGGVCVCVCVCVHVNVVYEDTNLYNDMGMT